MFGSNAQLRAIAEEFATDDAETRFVDTFVDGWTRVMMNDRFDVKG